MGCFFPSFAWILLLGASDHFLLHLCVSESKNLMAKSSQRLYFIKISWSELVLSFSFPWKIFVFFWVYLDHIWCYFQLVAELVVVIPLRHSFSCIPLWHSHWFGKSFCFFSLFVLSYRWPLSIKNFSILKDDLHINPEPQGCLKFMPALFRTLLLL